MKKLTKLLFSGVLTLAVAPAAVLSLASMKESQVVRAYSGGLTNFQEVNGVLSWDAFPGAADYDFMFGVGGGLTSGATSIDLEYEAKLHHYESGTYNYRVYAIDEDYNQISDASQGTYDYVSTQTPLDTPSNLAWDHAKATWDSVPNAVSYGVVLYRYSAGSFVHVRSFVATELYCDFGEILDVDVTYKFTVQADPGLGDLDHKKSNIASSTTKSFSPVIATLDGHVSITNGQLNVTDVEGAAIYDYQIWNQDPSYNLGGGTTDSLPIDLYKACTEFYADDGIYNIEIVVYNSFNEPLAPRYIYENWEYDSSAAPQHLTGTVEIEGTLKAGETLTAVHDTNNTGSLLFTWYRKDSFDNSMSVQYGPSNTFVLREEDVGYRFYVAIESDVEVGYLYSEVTAQIAPADEPEVLTGTVSITGTLKFGETLTANVTGDNNTGTLSYQWKRYADNIAGANSQTYTIVEEDIGKTLKCVVTSSVETGSIQSAATTEIAKANGPAAPTGITATACTTSDNNDGIISGVTTAMEYKLSLATDWIPGTGSDLTGLVAGTYNVRVKETATHNAGEAVNVNVAAYEAPEQYSIAVTNGTSDYLYAEAGQTVTITANAPAVGYIFDHWTSSDVTFDNANNATTTFVMPAKAVSISATYSGAPLTGTVSISGLTKFGKTLTANVSESNNTGDLSYQWKRGSDAIVGATAQTYVLTADDIGQTLSVVVASSVQTGSIQSAATSIIAKADGPTAPTGITATACTTEANNDGTLVGVTVDMEYKLSSESVWTSGTGSIITGLVAGTFNVRVKETVTHNAGEVIDVIVYEYNAPTVLQSITLSGTFKTSFEVDDTFSYEGLVVTAHYNNKADEVVTGYTVSSPDMSVAGNKTITVSYTEEAVTKTAIYQITVTAKEQPPVDPEPETPSKGGLSGGAITGIVIGSVLVAGIGGFALVWFVFKKKTWADFIAIFKKK